MSPVWTEWVWLGPETRRRVHLAGEERQAAVCLLAV